MAPYILVLLAVVSGLMMHLDTQKMLDRISQRISILSDSVALITTAHSADAVEPSLKNSAAPDQIQLDAFQRIAFSLHLGQKANVTWLNCGIPVTYELQLQSVSGSADTAEASIFLNQKPMNLKIASPVAIDGLIGALELISVHEDFGDRVPNSFLWTGGCGAPGDY